MPTPLRAAIEAATLRDETRAVDALVVEARTDEVTRQRIADLAGRLVQGVRDRQHGHGGLDAFLHEYSLTSREGVVLMCLAEALLRVPDAETANRLIRDKIGDADWEGHLGHSHSIFVNASTWALMLTGRVVQMDDGPMTDIGGALRRLVAKSGEPVIRQALVQAMRIMGRQFVMGQTIEEALARAQDGEEKGYRHSYDMLGEAARTRDDAERYYQAYADAIAAVGRSVGDRDVIDAPGISVKLSALHPRYELAQKTQIMAELVPRLQALAVMARDAGIGLCVDAEEADRLDISLDVIEAAVSDPRLAGWYGFGLAVQAYQKRAVFVIDWLVDLARRNGRRMMVRLVKGAYWDTEIKRGQEQGLSGYPVFTRKASTDVSYLACARRLLASPEAIYPQFATHNAHTIAAVLDLADSRRDFECQRLHGMGEALYDQVVGPNGLGIPCRVYAPVGGHEDLLAYLVRRLLENGANTSFVNRIVDERAPVADIVADPVQKVAALPSKPHPRIPLPVDLFQPERRNSKGLDLKDPATLRDLKESLAKNWRWQAAPIVGGRAKRGNSRPVLDPANRRREVGSVIEASASVLDGAIAAAAKAAPAWDRTPADERAKCLDRAADLFEQNMPELMALAVREAGKTISDALAEVREAVDYCRYYGARARIDFAKPQAMPGPTGEANELGLYGRGVFACISPWNFPLAIFAGQVTAALAAGNTVVAKPAEQTPLIATRAVQLLHEAGVPADALHLLPGDGPTVGAPLIADPRISGVVFTGSVETAHSIHRTLAARTGPIVPLIAETGGQNVMIVDSTALSEQVVADAVTSAFQSAGQRCSALRILFLQKDVADRIIRMLSGAIAELVVGDPGALATDVGPVIDSDALETLTTHVRRMEQSERLIARTSLTEACAFGTFLAPQAFEIKNLTPLKREVFGPVLHVIRYAADRLDRVIDDINALGYGLTLGVHSRVDATVRHVVSRVRAGNAYVNRNMIGAVVGVQPFGGEGLSGTGPKAGGPRYLHRFAVERTVSVNTVATGGNAKLLSLAEDDPTA